VILTDEQIKKYILEPSHGDSIARAKELYTSHIRHVKGVGVEDFFIKQEIKGYESEADKLLRKEISRATTVPIFSSALGFFEKTFSASGYSRYFEFTNDKDKSKSKELELYLNTSVWEGNSMSKMMSTMWGDKIHYDFNGVFMVELPKASDEESLVGETNKPYVIFKSITDIHDYDIDGMTVEYLILKTECPYDHEHKDDGSKYYRVIDSERDVIARNTNNEVTILNTKEYPQLPNIWGYVPAIIVSDQLDATTEARQSFIWQSIGTADEYLLDSSIQSVSKKKHGFPQKWSYQVPCKQCTDQTGAALGKLPIYGEYVNGERQISGWTPCKSCNGSASIPVSPSSVVLKPMPDANNPDIGEPFGYVVPDIDSIKFQVDELERLEAAIHEAITSVVDVDNGEAKSDQTATGRVLDVSAKQVKLNKFSSNAETVEQFLTDAIGKALYGNDFIRSIVRYGRKYYILTENEIERSFNEAKKSGVNASVLKSYMEELIYVRYATDPIELALQLKLFEAEPFPHMTVDEVQNLKYASEADKYMKTYFNDYIEYIMRTNPEIVTLGTIEQLQLKLKEVNKLKMIESGAIDANGNPISSDKESEARSQLRGSVGGVQALTDLIQKVSENPTIKESAIAIIETFYGLDNATAKRIVGDTSSVNNPQP